MQGQVILNKNDEVVMKLLHYFITEQGYSPIILHGAKNEIWLENLNGDYKIIRIVSNYIHNDEQFKFDIFRTKQIVKSIRRKTLSFKVNVLNIFLNLGDNVNFDNHVDEANITSTYIKEISDLNKYNFVMEIFPDITNHTDFKEEGFELFSKITRDIESKNQIEAREAEETFKPKKIIVTYILIAINIVVFLLMYAFGNGSSDSLTLLKFGASYPALIKRGEIYRLVTSAFIHIGVFHLAFNMYALYVIGSQLESYLGKLKFILIYLFSAITGSLLSMLFFDGISAGASGAVFGLLGSMLYFGYHYRVFLGNVVKSQIIPLIILNLFLGFVSSGINNAAHIGGLIGGFLITAALGVKYKSTKTDRINGIIMSLIFLVFLIYMGFFR